MSILRCDRSHATAWNEFVGRAPGASFYHRWEWGAINEAAFGHETACLAAFDGAQLTGVLPLVRLKSRLFGHIACSMPFVNYGGPAGLSDEIERDLVSAAAQVAETWGVDYVEIRSQRQFGERYPTSEHKVSLRIRLDRDPDEVLARMPRDHRAEIRRASKRGFVARFGPELIDDFYLVLSESWRDLGTPLYRVGYLKAILDGFPGATRLCVIYDQAGRPAAGAFDGLHNDTVEGMWLAMRGEYRRQLVGYVLYWELIKNACEQGFRVFHLGRSSRDSGGEQFKKKWAADAVQLYWQYILRSRSDIPALNPDNERFRLAIRVWQKLPLWITQAIGPQIARSIP